MLPQNPKVHWGNPITRGLTACVVPSTLQPNNLVAPSLGYGTKGSDVYKVATPHGWGFGGMPGTQDSNPCTRYLSDIPYTPSSGVFTVMGFSKMDEKNNECPFGSDRRDMQASTWSWQLLCKGAATLPYRVAFVCVNDGTGIELLKFGTTQVMNTGRYHVAIGRYFGDGTNPALDLWVDGVKQGTTGNDSVDGTAFTRNTSAEGLMCIGAYYNFLNTHALKGQYVIFGYWNRLLSDKEVLSLSHNPLQIIQSYRNIFIPGIRSEDVTPPHVVRVR